MKIELSGAEELGTSYTNTMSIEFNVGRPFRRTHMGKHWPITTQCVIKMDNIVVGVGEVVKHELDKDNPKYARMYAAKKAFAQTRLWPELRERAWKKILTIE